LTIGISLDCKLIADKVKPSCRDLRTKLGAILTEIVGDKSREPKTDKLSSPEAPSPTTLKVLLRLAKERIRQSYSKPMLAMLELQANLTTVVENP
jgi:hypothetical protein